MWWCRGRAYWTFDHGRLHEAAGAGNFRHCPVLGIDVRDYDLVGDPAAVDTIVDQVRARLKPVIP